MKRFVYIFFCFLITSEVAAAETIERIEYDSSTGNYIIWEDVDGVPTPNTFIPATKVNTQTIVEM